MSREGGPKWPKPRLVGQPTDGGPELAASATMSLYRHWVSAGRELERLSRCLTRRHCLTYCGDRVCQFGNLHHFLCGRQSAIQRTPSSRFRASPMR